MTKDMIDSMLRSALSSDWVQDLVDYGVTVSAADAIPCSL